ncbi:MAG TPA: site-specific integrase [Paraburkholderia sp.]|nr:site-specific integrase [Paraburkholderia sp.]
MSDQIKRAAVVTSRQIKHLLRVTDATSQHPERDSVVLRLGLNVGMRITECALITVADVMFSHGHLRTEISLREAITKGCRQRTVYFTGRKLIDARERYFAYRVQRGLGATLDESRYRGLNSDMPLVLSRTGYPYSLNRKVRVSAAGEQVDYWAADTLQAYVTGLYRDAGLKGATTHTGRRSFATRLINRGATVE